MTLDILPAFIFLVLCYGWLTFRLIVLIKNQYTKQMSGGENKEDKSAADMVAELAALSGGPSKNLKAVEKIIESSLSEGEIRQRLMDEIGLKRNEFGLHVISEEEHSPDWTHDNDVRTLQMKSGSKIKLKF